MSDTTPPKPITTPAPPSANTQNRNTILLGLGGAMAVGIPASIHEIGSPLTRVLVSFVGLVIVFGLGYFTVPGIKK